jgi:hypothetical protein
VEIEQSPLSSERKQAPAPLSQALAVASQAPAAASQAPATASVSFAPVVASGADAALAAIEAAEAEVAAAKAAAEAEVAAAQAAEEAEAATIVAAAERRAALRLQAVLRGRSGRLAVERARGASMVDSGAADSFRLEFGAAWSVLLRQVDSSLASRIMTTERSSREPALVDAPGRLRTPLDSPAPSMHSELGNLTPNSASSQLPLSQDELAARRMRTLTRAQEQERHRNEMIRRLESSRAPDPGPSSRVNVLSSRVSSSPAAAASKSPADATSSALSPDLSA